MSKQSEQSIFADDKEPGALRTIGEVAAAIGVKQHVLRYWEQQFPMLRPLQRGGGRRYYRPEDVELIVLIDRLVNQDGYTLKGARQAIETSRRQQKSTPPTEAASSKSDTGSSEQTDSSGNNDVAKAALQKAALQNAVKQGSHIAAEDLLPRLQGLRDRLAAALN